MSIVQYYPVRQGNQIRPLEFYVLTFLMKTEVSHRILKGGGNDLNIISYETNTQIEIINFNSLENLVLIRGKLECCTAATLRILFTYMNDDTKSTNIFYLITHDVLIGRLIGNQGRTLHYMMQNSQTSIAVSRADINGFYRNINRVIIIRGNTLEKVGIAIKLVSIKLKTNLDVYVAESMPGFPCNAFLNPLLISPSITQNENTHNGQQINSLVPIPFVPNTAPQPGYQMIQNGIIMNGYAVAPAFNNECQMINCAVNNDCQIMNVTDNNNTTVSPVKNMITTTIRSEVRGGTTFFYPESIQPLNDVPYNEPNSENTDPNINEHDNVVPYAEPSFVNDEPNCSSNNEESESEVDTEENSTHESIVTIVDKITKLTERVSLNLINVMRLFDDLSNHCKNQIVKNDMEYIGGDRSQQNLSTLAIKEIHEEILYLTNQNEYIYNSIKKYTELLQNFRKNKNSTNGTEPTQIGQDSYSQDQYNEHADGTYFRKSSGTANKQIVPIEISTQLDKLTRTEQPKNDISITSQHSSSKPDEIYNQKTQHDANLEKGKRIILNPGAPWWSSLGEKYLILLASVDQNFILPYCYLCNDMVKEIEHCTVYIPKIAVGSFIGLHGFHIRTLMRISDAFITVLQDKIVKNGECVIEIVGNCESQWKAQYLIYNKLIMEHFSLNVNRTMFTVTMKIPSKHAGRIIGGRGRIVKAIEKRSNCSIQLPLPEERLECAEVTCSICGTFYDVIKAQRLIRTKIHEHKNYHIHVVNSSDCTGNDCERCASLRIIRESYKIKYSYMKTKKFSSIPPTAATIAKRTFEAIQARLRWGKRIEFPPQPYGEMLPSIPEEEEILS